MTSLQELKAEADLLEHITATRADGTKLKGVQAKDYLNGLKSACTDPDMYLRTDSEAPLGCLRWLHEDTDEPEDIPSANCVDYELSYDQYGCVYPALAMRDSNGDMMGGVQFTADGLLELGQWALQSAFGKLELTGMGVGAITGRGVLLEQVNTLMTSLVRIAPETLTERVSDTAKQAIVKDVEHGIQARLEANNVAYLNSIERKHAAEVMELARIAARVDQDSREDALASPNIEKLIVNAKEMLDADSTSSVLAALTRQG